MITFILTLLLAVVLTLSLFNGLKRPYKIILVLAIILTIISTYITYKVTNYEVTKYNIPLINLKDNTYISGNIRVMLGSGGGEVKEQYEYTMYYKTKNGAKLLRLPVEQCEIIFGDTPKIVVIELNAKFNNTWKDWFVINNPKTKYYVIIPKDSFDGKFILDAE